MRSTPQSWTTTKPSSPNSASSSPSPSTRSSTSGTSTLEPHSLAPGSTTIQFVRIDIRRCVSGSRTPLPRWRPSCSRYIYYTFLVISPGSASLVFVVVVVRIPPANINEYTLSLYKLLFLCSRCSAVRRNVRTPAPADASDPSILAQLCTCIDFSVIPPLFIRVAVAIFRHTSDQTFPHTLVLSAYVHHRVLFVKSSLDLPLLSSVTHFAHTLTPSAFSPPSPQHLP